MPKRRNASSTSKPPSQPATLSTTKPTTPAHAPIPSTLTDSLPLPSLVVFDLDYTLWPFWVDTHVSGPLKPQADQTQMMDRCGERFGFYQDVPAILSAARSRGVEMGLASRTSAPDLARQMLRGLYVEAATTDHTPTGLKAETFFAHLQIYPGSKTTHFRKIHEDLRRRTGGREVSFADMLFFDDESRNRNVETELGVTFCLVREGLTSGEFDRGVWEWRRRRGIQRPVRPGTVELEA